MDRAPQLVEHESSPAATDEAKDAIRAKAIELGFDAVGFAAPGPAAAQQADLAAFLDAGAHGDMDWMARTRARRGDPRRLWPELRSIVALGLNYGPHEDPLAALGRAGEGAVSVYARGRDYHELVKKRLKRLAGWMHRAFDCEVKVFVDTAPVMEKPAAARAGLGWQGKHTNLVSTRFGSWLFLGEIFTTLELAPDAAHADRCGGCRRCLDICPTGAFPAPYRIDARRCISYLTIEHKGHIAREFRAAMGNRIYGCDDCLAVCPWNKFARQTAELAFAPRAALDPARLADLASLDDGAFRRAFAGSPIKRLGRDRFVRNVLIAIGNAGDAALRAAVEPRLSDASPLVRAMAVWASAQLLGADAFGALRDRRLPAERDGAVRAEWEAGG